MPSNSRLQSIYTLLKLRYHSNYDISVLQLLFCKDYKFERMRGCNCSVMIVKGSFIEWVRWNCKLTQYFSKTCQIDCIHAIHGCKCSSKKHRIHWEINGCTYLHEIKKHLTLKKNCSLRLNAVSWKELFLGTDTLDHTLFYALLFH